MAMEIENRNLAGAQRGIIDSPASQVMGFLSHMAGLQTFIPTPWPCAPLLLDLKSREHHGGEGVVIKSLWPLSPVGDPQEV
jgi:hypothetical protein